MAEWDRLLASITNTIVDYRAGAACTPTAAHVEKWIGQFPVDVRQPILAEMEHVLSRTYFSKASVKAFLTSLLEANKIAGNDSCGFWRGVTFLAIQTAGNSQRELLELFSEALFERCGYTIKQCGGGSTFVYLDDVMCTGNRIRRDLTQWVAVAPTNSQLHVIVIAGHTQAYSYANQGVQAAVDASGKVIERKWWHARKVENTRANIADSDVLWPTQVPNDARVQAYVQGLAHAPIPRPAGNIGGLGLFSSDVGRQLLEQEFTKIGAYIRTICPHLNQYQRPLGNMVLQGLGFGSMFVTYRNCPNNAPLALWAGDPWYPLFPRKTN